MSQLPALQQALALSPDNIPLLQLYAEACLAQFAIEEARVSFEKILSLNPRQREAKLGLARVLQQMGKSSEAVVRVESVIQEYPNHPDAYLLLSRLLMAEGQREQAVELYQRGLKLPGAIQDPSLEKDLYLTKSTPASELPGNRVVNTSEGWTQEGTGTIEDEPTLSHHSFDLEGAALERPKITFAEVGGMEWVKEEIRMKILYPLKNPDLFRAYGKKIGGGVLLYGPPGCGKTLISRATAGEIKANFISIGIHQILDMYLGQSERKLHEIFQTARQHAPCILFFDEVDALAADRTDLRKSAGRTLINQFLAEMDGNVAENEGLLILGATNAPWHMDPAFRRPGRFDRILFVPPPDEEARASIIPVLAKGKPITDLDANLLAKKTKDFSGADLKAIFDVTIERNLAQAMKIGRIVPLTMKDLLESTKVVRPSTKAWFESAKNYAMYSNQGGFYNDVLSFLGIKP